MQNRCMRICMVMEHLRKTNIIFLLILLLFVILQSNLYHPVLSDENQYFYLGKEISEGSIPYKDFFFSHPPLQLYIFAFIFKMVFYNFYILKSIAIISTIISAIIIFKLAESNSAKLIAPTLFLFNATLFFSGAANMGINLTTLIILLGFYLISKKKLFEGGLLFGLALMTGLYSIVIFFATCIFLWKKSGKVILGFIVTALPLNLFFYAMSGFDYIKQVFLYHFLKPMEGSTLKLAFFSNLVMRDIVLFFLVLLCITFFIGSKGKLRNIYLYNIIAYLVFIALLSKPISYYMVLVYPMVALFIVEMIDRIKTEQIKFVAVICVFLLVGFMGFRTVQGIDTFNERNQFGKLDEVVEYMEDKEGKLFGDFDVATLVALETGMDMIVSKDLDTYPLAVKLIGVEKIADEIERLQPSYIIIHQIGSTMNPLWRAERIKDFMERNCIIEKEIKENKNIYLVFGCSY